MHILVVKLLAILSVMRLPNIFALLLAQYLTSIFIMSEQTDYLKVLFDRDLFWLIFCTCCNVVSGYIINSYFDLKKDIINRPIRTKFEFIIGYKTKLMLYIILNLIMAVVSLSLSIKVFLFFVSYALGIFLYSAFIKKIILLGNLVSVLLTITPFLAVCLYFENFKLIIVPLSSFLFLIILMYQLLKDLNTLKGDFTFNYKTIPTVFGENTTKVFITICSVLLLSNSFWIIYGFELGIMTLYFDITVLFLPLFIIALWTFTKPDNKYLLLSNITKGIIALGVLSIAFFNKF